MNLQPIDEMSLRHLFSTAFAQEVLHLSYIGPVLNDTGSVESSPDCMILDMRESPFRPLRCEFKFNPSGKVDFADNGRFDVAITWLLQQGCSRDQLKAELLVQNGCFEIIVLSDMKAFRDLPPYSNESLSRLGGVGTVRKKALDSEVYSVYALYIAAKIYPGKFHLDNMINLLLKRFPKVKKMQPKGRANAAIGFVQTKPPLITCMHKKYYRWTSEFDSVIAASELAEVIVSNFGGQLPADDELKTVE